jgi:hypothetical protein
MKAFILATAIATVVVAGSARAHSNVVAGATPEWRHTYDKFRNSNASAATRDPIGVCVEGRETGRDPDPNVREELKNEYYVQQGR